MAALLGILLLIIPLWNICRRAGYHPGLALIGVVPFLGLVAVAAILAFTDWPVATRKRIERGGAQ